MDLIWLIIVVLVILWLLGYFGRGRISTPALSGNAIHTLLVIVVILVILRLLSII
ncbi:MAG: lmo0937 family membrane protein [Chloroflexota bacterium]